MNRYRRNDKAVSPVIATILMVAITVVLAGVLVVYLQTLPQSGGNVETAYGLRVEKTSAGDWLISITGGAQNAGDVTIQVLNTAGTKTYSSKVNVMAAADGVFNDNNGNSKLDAGDSILLKDTAYVAGPPPTGVDPGFKVQFLKGDNIVGTIKELPS